MLPDKKTETTRDSISCGAIIIKAEKAKMKALIMVEVNKVLNQNENQELIAKKRS